MLVGYHTHTQGSLTVFDEALAQSKYNAINVDIGHYVAGTSESPIPLILKHHSRFASIHLKDRKKADGPNMPWGQGDTPIKEVLQLMKKEKYNWPATIELDTRCRRARRAWPRSQSAFNTARTPCRRCQVLLRTAELRAWAASVRRLKLSRS